MVQKGTTIKKKRRAMETIMPPTWPKGPVQHRMVIDTITKISFKPRVMNHAEIAWLKKLLFCESTPKCSYFTIPNISVRLIGNNTMHIAVCKTAICLSTEVIKRTSNCGMMSSMVEVLITSHPEAANWIFEILFWTWNFNISWMLVFANNKDFFYKTCTNEHCLIFSNF